MPEAVFGGAGFSAGVTYTVFGFRFWVKKICTINKLMI